MRVKSSGYWLYDHEQECRDYILQCWAEAKARYDAGTIPNFANKALREQYAEAQEGAMEDDWRVGAIEHYLSLFPVGGLVCIRQLKHEALSVNRDFPQDPTPKESQEIGIIMNKMEGWEKAGRRSVVGYGQQRCWERVASRQGMEIDELPF